MRMGGKHSMKIVGNDDGMKDNPRTSKGLEAGWLVC